MVKLGHKAKPVVEIVDYDFQTVSFKLLADNGLLPNDYFFLFLLYHESRKRLDEIFGHETYRKFARINRMVYLGYLTEQIGESGYPVLTEKFEQDFIVKGARAFAEIVDTFPVKTPRGDRYYRKGATTVRHIYIKLISKNAALHRHIVNCLKFEIKQRERTKTLQYLACIDTWISERHWEAVQEDMLRSVTSERELVNETGFAKDEI